MKFLTKAAAFALVIGVLFAGCKSAHDDDHLDINGFELLLDNQIIASQSGTTVTGTVQITAGLTTGTILVTFVDGDGHALIITDDDFSANIESSNQAVVSVSRVNNFSFTLAGVSEGTAKVTVNLYHGTHKDFESRPVTVNVNAVSAE